MDRHHLLSLLDKILDKYKIQDGEYKEFVEAIGGKKSPIEVNEGDLVRVSYDFLECEVDFCEDEFYPKVHVTERCSRIWKITANETDYHGESMISYRYMHNSEMHLGAMRKIVKDYSNNKFTMLTLNSHKQSKYCCRVYNVEVL